MPCRAVPCSVSCFAVQFPGHSVPCLTFPRLAVRDGTSCLVSVHYSTSHMAVTTAASPSWPVVLCCACHVVTKIMSAITASIWSFSRSGSALLGGWLSDKIHYQYTFLITAVLQGMSILCLVPLIPLVAAEKHSTAVLLPRCLPMPRSSFICSCGCPTNPTRILLPPTPRPSLRAKNRRAKVQPEDEVAAPGTLGGDATAPLLRSGLDDTLVSRAADACSGGGGVRR